MNTAFLCLRSLVAIVTVFSDPVFVNYCWQMHNRSTLHLVTSGPYPVGLWQLLPDCSYVG